MQPQHKQASILQVEDIDNSEFETLEEFTNRWLKDKEKTMQFKAYITVDLESLMYTDNTYEEMDLQFEQLNTAFQEAMDSAIQQLYSDKDISVQSVDIEYK